MHLTASDDANPTASPEEFDAFVRRSCVENGGHELGNSIKIQSNFINRPECQGNSALWQGNQEISNDTLVLI